MDLELGISSTITEARNQLLLLGGVILLSFFFWLFIIRPRLPHLAEAIRAFLTGDNGNYQSADDELHQLIERARATRDHAILTELDRYCRDNARRLLAWQEYARALDGIYNRPLEAAQLLEEAATHVRSKQDRALLLYRAAIFYRDRLSQSAEAQRLFEQAAKNYPRTTYGQLAAQQLS